MPSKSKKQHNLMALVANNPKAAKRLNIPQSVGEEFMKADKGKKFAKGGMSKHEDVKMDKKVVKKAIGMHDKQLHGGKKTSLEGLKAGGSVKKMAMGGRPIVSQPGPMTGLPKAMGGSPAPKTKPAPKSNQGFPSYSEARAKADQIKEIRARYGMMKKGGVVKKYAAGGDISADDYVEESVREQKKMAARKKQNEADRKMLEKKYPPKKDVAEDDMPPKDSKGNYIKPRPYKSGGSCSAKKYARGGGIEVRGKTRGKII